MDLQKLEFPVEFGFGLDYFNKIRLDYRPNLNYPYKNFTLPVK